MKDLEQTIADYVTKIASATDAAAKSEAFNSWLKVQQTFWHYSWRNQILILLQCPTATNVAGFHKWKQLNRFVLKGQHGISILAPRLYKDKETDEQHLAGFIPVTVFDISQTDGEPLPTIEWQANEVNEALQSKLLAYATSKGIKVVVGELGETRGASFGGKIILNAKAGTKTLVHELAHETLHYGTDDLSHDEKELEAETVGYVVSQFFGLDTTVTSANYLAIWHCDSKKIIGRLTRIAQAAKELIQAAQ